MSGGKRGAIDGTLSIMVGEPEEVFKRVRPVLEVLGKQVCLIGDAEAGQVAKAILSTPPKKKDWKYNQKKQYLGELHNARRKR